MESLTKEHIDKFGKEPNIIGLFWYDTSLILEGIANAIDNGKAYDEYEMLSKDEQKLYNDGKLLF